MTSSAAVAGVLTVGVHLARPAGLGGEVDLRVQRGADAECDVLLAGDVGEAADHAGVADSREAKRLGPLRQMAGGDGGPGVLAECVARVCREGDRDAVRRLLGQLLQCVVPADRLADGGQRADVEMVEQLAENDVPRGRGGEAGGGDVRSGLTDPEHRVKQEARLLLYGEPRDEVGDPLLGGEPEILVWIQLPVAVEVPKLHAVRRCRPAARHCCVLTGLRPHWAASLTVARRRATGKP